MRRHLNYLPCKLKFFVHDWLGNKIELVCQGGNITHTVDSLPVADFFLAQEHEMLKKTIFVVSPWSAKIKCNKNKLDPNKNTSQDS